MNRLLRFLSVFMLLAAGLPAIAQSTEGIEQFNMPKKDGRQGDKTVNGQLQFYDMGGPTGNTVAYYAGYTRFVPSVSSNQIQLSFSTMDLTGNATVYIYDGDINFTRYSEPIPEGYIAKLTGYDVGSTYVSTSGSLSVLYACVGNGSGAGWTATVEELSPKDQEWQGLSASQDNLTAFRGQRNAPVMRVNLLTDGGKNPLQCTSLSFSLDGTTSPSDLSNLKVIYSKGTDTPTGEQFGETINNADGRLVFNGNLSLRSGNNYFWLVADVNANPATGSVLDATLTAATIGGSEKIETPLSPDGAVSIDNTVLLSSTPAIYNVGTTPVTLYDDGGPQGNISEKFNGYATFVPTTPGNKVRIRFTSLDLFNTSTVDLNDRLDIYAGRQIDESALLATVLKEAITVSSNAPDGSLTVSLLSKTGVPKGGFTAIVEEFTPQPMVISSISATHPEPSTIAAGQTNEKLLLINVITENTEPAVSLNTFNCSNTSTAPLSKTSLYYLGSTENGTPRLIGDCDSPSATFSISTDSDVTLKERNNFFLLTIDTAEQAVNGQFADMAILSVANGANNTNATEGNPEGTRAIENVYYSTTGNFTKTIYGDWVFNNTPSQYSYYGYDDTAGDQISTFIPGTERRLIELDFSQFRIMSNNYGANPKFIVYDGSSTSAPILWEMDKNTLTTGPDNILRASNSEGALTVLFNSGGIRGSQGYGFKANMREYLSVNMAVTGAEAYQQSNEAVVRPATADLPVLCLSVTTAGDKNPLAFESVTLNLKDCGNAVSKVKLYTTGKSAEFAATTLLAEAEPNGNSIILSPTTSFTMPEKTTYFWVAYDMANTFASDIPVDAAISELKIGDNAIAVTNADPEGAAITKNMYYFADGDNTITVNGSLMFYDDGGPDGKYTTNAKGKVTFLPANEDEVIRMTVRSFWTNYQDHLYIYYGAATSEGETASADLSGSKSESDLPIVIISKSEDGALTAYFSPKKNNINNGWEILVESFKPAPMKVASVEVSPVNDIKALRGSTDNIMLKLAVTVTGEKGTVTLSKLNFDCLGSDTEAISDTKVWYTGEVDNFDNNTLFGTAISGTTFSFEGDITYDTAGTYYYWLTYDIAPDAANDSKIQAQFTSLTAGENTVTPTEDKSVLITVQDGIHGTFSIGTSGEYDFLNITDAINSLVNGIDGPVVFELADGNYNELVNIPQVIGSSERNTITICSKSGRRENVIISYNTYRDPGSSNYDKRYGVVTFDGVDYCTIRDITVTTTATNFPGLVFLRNKSNHDSLKNCVITTTRSKDSAKGSSLVYMYAKNEANANNNYLTVEDCMLDGGYIGVGLTGTSYTALPKQRGGTIKGCTFRNQGSKAIYVNCEEDASILNNTIFGGGDTISSYNAMDISDAAADLTVAGNTVNVQDPTSSATALYIRGYNLDKYKAGHRRFYNNEINITGVTGSTTGMRINNKIDRLEFQYNTLRLSGTGNAYGIFMAEGIPAGCIANNIIQNETSGTAVHVQRESYLENVAFNHNIMYTAGDVFAYIGADKSYDEWAAATDQTDSFNERTEFLSANVLEPAQAGNLITGAPIAYITTDLYGAPRSKTTPTIGAYEYAESTVAPAFTEGYPAISNITHDTATLSAASTLTGTMNYVVMPADEAAPAAADIKNEDLMVELRKGVVVDIPLAGLSPKTDYKVYAILTSLRGLESGVIASGIFTTTYEPTRVATFEEAITEEGKITDGTMSFTGFSIVAITDGIAPAPNTQAAQMDDEYAVVMLTNADNLPIEGMFMRNTAPVSLSSKDNKLKQVAGKQVAASDAWRYVDLRDMGNFTYLEFESEGTVLIDNFAAQPLSLLVSVDFDSETPVTSGSQVAIPSITDGGVAPYTYTWRNALLEEIGTQATLTFSPEVSGSYTVEVTDARGAKANADVKVRVLGQQKMATFDDLYLAPESHWYGDIDDEDYMNGSFFSGSFEFNNMYMADWDNWAFFGYANHTSTDFGSFTTDQWNSAVGHGVDDSPNYGILYVSPFMGKSITTLTNTAEGETIPGMYVTNSAWVVDAILNGDGMEGKFEQGDLLTLKVTGSKADGSSSTIEIPLADYRSDLARDHWYLDTWQWVDLSSLGNVKALEWEINSTKQNAYGVTTPTYVCLDNLGAFRPVSDAAPVVIKLNEETPSDSFDLTPYFSFDETEATVSYAIECEDPGVTLSDAIVTVTGIPGTELSLVAHAASHGKHEYVRIPVSIERKTSGIDNITLGQLAVYPNPADTYVNVSAEISGYNIEIISMDGRTLIGLKGLDGKTTINISDLAAGNYLVRFSAADGSSAVRKLIVK